MPRNALVLSALGMVVATILSANDSGQAYLILFGISVFAAIVVWILILATHTMFRVTRRKEGLPPSPVQLWGAPVTSGIVALFLAAVLVSTFFIEGLDPAWQFGLPFFALLVLTYVGLRSPAAATTCSPSPDCRTTRPPPSADRPTVTRPPSSPGADRNTDGDDQADVHEHLAGRPEETRARGQMRCCEPQTRACSCPAAWDPDGVADPPSQPEDSSASAPLTGCYWDALAWQRPRSCAGNARLRGYSSTATVRLVRGRGG